MKKTKSAITKLILCVTLLTVSLLCNACATHLYYEGLDRYSKETSSVGLTKYLIPDGFLDEFEYVDGNYFYKYDDTLPLVHTIESTLIYLTYEDSVYEDAKNYVLSDFEVNEEKVTPIGTCGSYNFYLNKKSHYETNSKHFNAFTYNDDSKTLVFVGFDSIDKLYKYEDNQIVNFDDLIKKYFPWCDFES